MPGSGLVDRLGLAAGAFRFWNLHGFRLAGGPGGRPGLAPRRALPGAPRWVR